MTSTTFTGYQRALDAEPQLQPVARLVDALCALVRPTDRMCSACVWETILNPLVTPWVGWSRGHMPEQATDDPPGTIHVIGGDPMGAPFKVTSWVDFFAEQDAHEIPATTETEAWLRTSEAYDAFTGELLRRLKAADPANGHGIAAHRTED